MGVVVQNRGLCGGGDAEYPSKMKISGRAPQKGASVVIVTTNMISEYPSKMKTSGKAPQKGGRKKSQRTGVQPCTHPSWIENTLENEGRARSRRYRSWSSRPNTRRKALY